jgi:hypothetical protein
MRASLLPSSSVVVCVTILQVFGAGCEPLPTALTPYGERVVLSKADAPRKCREVGTVSAEDEQLRIAQNKMRNAAAELGGNYVRWDHVKPGYIVSGTAFECASDALEK